MGFFVAGTDIILQTSASGSFESRFDFECMVLRLDLGFYSHLKEPHTEESRYPLTVGWIGEKLGKVSFSRKQDYQI